MYYYTFNRVFISGVRPVFLMEDIHFMERALALAQNGIGCTSPNPAVGAVLVKDGVIIGEGYHQKAGEPHAEVHAIVQAKQNNHDVRGAHLYVTLEPCCHMGRTPPCTDLLIQEGVARVVVGMRDSFQLVDGQGMVRLADAGVAVALLPETHPLIAPLRETNQAFIKWAQTGLPYVIMKTAVSLDGKIATRNGISKWITNDAARDDARLERSRCDAVLIGGGTVVADDPELSTNDQYADKRLLRVVIDPTLSLPTTARVFRDEHVFIATTDRAKKRNHLRFLRQGISFESFGRKEVSFKRLLQYLGRHDIQSVFIEGGGGVHGRFYDEARVDPLLLDRVVWYIAPTIIGGSGAFSAVAGQGVCELSETIPLKDVHTEMIGNNIKVTARANWY